ncbi:hypothetical protein BCR42DRAFT_423621 [Absidia repens]|uniref:Arrestin C-terminal-like domain-containing protein n=1 Tax=Absidia repens TaxID=90262 RepID=A0A1X2I535_9FUNG|nr:hypothetical protein BCR42DRAFT_423621 [Absidia repens]
MLFCKPLSIDLVEPVVYLHGTKDKHGINILRGIIRLQLKRPIHMESVTLRFVGISKTLWPEASEHWDKQVLVDSIIPICKTPMYLKKGAHAFPFEILLSNALSESIECGLGHVRYNLICEVHSQSSWHASLLPINTPLKAKQSVILVRLPSQDTPRCITQTHHVTPHDQLNMVVETAHLTPGAQLPVSLHFSRPESIQSLDSMTVKLIERQKFRAPSKQTTRILHHEITLQQQQHSESVSCGDNDSDDASDDDTRFVFLVPDSSSLQVHPTTTNRIIRVRHWIQVALTLTLTNGETKDIWMDTPITVLLSSLDDYHTLPVYQSMPTPSMESQTSPPPPFLASTSPTAITTTTRTSTSSSSSSSSSILPTSAPIKGSHLDCKKKSPSSFSIIIPPPQTEPLSNGNTDEALAATTEAAIKNKLNPSTWIAKLYGRHKEAHSTSPSSPTSSLLLPPSPLSLSSATPSSPTTTTRPSSSSIDSLFLPPTYQEFDHHPVQMETY